MGVVSLVIASEDATTQNKHTLPGYKNYSGLLILFFNPTYVAHFGALGASHALGRKLLSMSFSAIDCLSAIF